MLALCLLAWCCAPAAGNTDALADDDGADPVLGRLLTVGGAGVTLNALALDGDAAGLPAGEEGAELNGRAPGLEDVRAVFELDEWISFRLAYKYRGGYAKFGVWAFPHRDIGQYGELSELAGCAYFAEYELPYETYPDPLEDEFSIPVQVASPGLYDLLFSLDGRIVGRLVLRLYAPGELAGMSEQELAALK